MQYFQFRHKGQTIQFFTHDAPDYLGKVIGDSNQFYELDLLKKASKVWNGGTIIDVGANIGNHTIYFAKILRARVLAFEPFAKNRDVLLKNIAANDCAPAISVESVALGSVKGRATVKSFDPSNLGTVRVGADDVGDMEMIPLDDFLPNYVDVGLMKIDVEGAELEVLKGAEKTLELQKPPLFIESQTDKEFNIIRSHLAKFGYKVAGKYCWTPTYLYMARGWSWW